MWHSQQIIQRCNVHCTVRKNELAIFIKESDLQHIDLRWDKGGQG